MVHIQKISNVNFKLGVLDYNLEMDYFKSKAQAKTNMYRKKDQIFYLHLNFLSEKLQDDERLENMSHLNVPHLLFF
jgi:hypothetical protein